MFTPRKPTLLFLVALALVIGSKAIALVYFSFQFTGNDDLIFWQMARDYAHGYFFEPFMYGQNYNYGIESFFAVPLLKLGVPFQYALPITTAWMGVFPFVVFSFGFYRIKQFVPAIICVSIPVWMPIEYDIITTITRGFLNGLFFTSFFIFAVLKPSRTSSFFLFGICASLGVITNPNSVLLSIPVGIYLLLVNVKSLRFYVFTSVSMIPGFVLYYFSKQFYVLNPDYVVHQLPELTYAFSRIAETLVQLDRSFAYLSPLFLGFHWAILFLLVVGSVLLLKRDWRLGIALVLGLFFMLFSLGINKVEEGVGVIFFSPTRMFLAVPILFAFMLSWLLLKSNSSKLLYVLLLISCLSVCYKFITVESTVDFHTTNKSYGPVAIENIELLKTECRQFQSVATNYEVDLVVFTLSSFKNVPEVSFYNFGCELLVEDFPESTMLHKERRTALFINHKSEIVKNILFLNYELNEELSRNSGSDYEIIEEISNAILIKNNTRTLPEICELLELQYHRSKN